MAYFLAVLSNGYIRIIYIPWWHDYRRDGFPTLKFGVVIADLAVIPV